MSNLTEKIGDLIAQLHDAQEKIRKLEARTDNRKKLTEDEVKQIRRLRSDGMKIRVIADIYNVNPSTVSRTVRGDYHGVKWDR